MAHSSFYSDSPGKRGEGEMGKGEMGKGGKEGLGKWDTRARCAPSFPRFLISRFPILI